MGLLNTRMRGKARELEVVSTLETTTLSIFPFVFLGFGKLHIELNLELLFMLLKLPTLLVSLATLN